jgi:hypothetical protein
MPSVSLSVDESEYFLQMKGDMFSFCGVTKTLMGVGDGSTLWYYLKADFSPEPKVLEGDC